MKVIPRGYYLVGNTLFSQDYYSTKTDATKARIPKNIRDVEVANNK